MPDGITLAAREDDPFAWALTLAAQLRQKASLKTTDREALSDFLAEWAAEDVGLPVRGQMMVNSPGACRQGGEHAQP